MRKKICGNTLYALLFAIGIFLVPQAVAQDVDQELDTVKSEIKEIETKQAKTAEELEAEEEKIYQAEKKAEEIIENKEDLEEQVKIKEKEAMLAKKELAVAEREAKATKDPETIKKVKELSAKAEKLKKETLIYQDKLKIATSKSAIAQQKIETHKKEIEELKANLNDLRIRKNGKRNFFEQALVSIGIVLVGFIMFLLLKLGVKRLDAFLSKENELREDAMTLRLKTLGKLTNWLGGIAIFVLVLYMVLENHGINVAPLLAGAGIIGLAFGFGGQYLIRDLINGLFILIEGQFRINDVVKINENGGLVEDINLRITTLRDLAGRVIIIPNGEIKTVINFTRGYSQALLDIGVAYKENVDEVMKVIKGIGKEMRQDKHFGRLILDDLEMFGVDDFAESQVTIKFRIKTLPIKQWEVMREFRRRLKNKFDELGIEIPFPHTTVYWGTGKDNEWVRHFANKISQAKK
ncbi:MAG: mechanosensitive ion channel [Candidatus Omnitrophica bacterium]|nr:mechanosensitive ion channel [Candidatus Omnitrophota bacterium]